MPAALVVGNWKMNTTLAEAQALAGSVAASPPEGVEVVICPPFPWLVPLSAIIEGSAVSLGAQNCWPEPAGAFTGEVSVSMLADWCRYVIVGHSERRMLLGESDELVARKVRATLDAGLAPILCVGESLDLRRSGQAEAFVARQVAVALAGLDAADLRRCVIAYEPIWAIGTGEAASPADAAAMAKTVRAELERGDAGVGAAVRVLYGGSVTPANAAAFFAVEGIDGALVGGASLDAAAFLRIAAEAR